MFTKYLKEGDIGMQKAYVYWIHEKNQLDYNSEGYIGVTINIKRRIQNHKWSARNKIHKNKNLIEFLTNDNILFDIIFEGSEIECYEKENILRPNPNMGWNISPGGIKGGFTISGYSLTDEFRENCKNRMYGNKRASGGKGKPKSEEHRKKISEANKGKTVSEERKLKQSLAMRGRKASDETKEKIRLSLLGKKRGPYRKK